MPLLLTTLDRLKVYANADATADAPTWGAGLEALATQLIARVSRAIELECFRKFHVEERTKTFRLGEGQRLVFLDAFPVVGDVEVRLDADREFGDETIVDEDLYAVDTEQGSIEFIGLPAVYGPGVLRVTWTGGIAEDVDDVVAEDSELLDLAEACELQVLYEVRRRDNPGGTSTSGGGGSTTYEGSLKLLPRVRELIAHYRRLRHG